MKTTYAVKWREPDAQIYLGRLTLGPRTLRLEGREPDGPAVDRQIGYDEVSVLRVAGYGPGRLDGRPTLLIERAEGQYLIASAGMGAGIVQELVERIAQLRSDQRPEPQAVPAGHRAVGAARNKSAGNPQPICEPTRMGSPQARSTLKPATNEGGTR